MKLITTPGKPLLGDIALPGDKSLSHRAVLFAALADGESVIENFLMAGVTQVMLEALTSLGVDWTMQGSQLVIHGRGLGGLRLPAAPINCGNSATTMRLLAGALAAAGIPALLDGSPGLRRRPMGRIVAPLQAMGVPIQASHGGTAPLRLEARAESQLLHAINYPLPVSSAQVKTCLLLAALAADGACILHEPQPSRDHTERMLAIMGVDIQADGEQVRLAPSLPLRLRPLRLLLPGDISSAAFLIVATLITSGSQITFRDVLLNPTRTGLLEALGAMGAEIRVENRTERGGEPVGDIIVAHSRLRGTVVDGPLVVRMIDEFPAFAIAAAYAKGHTVVRGASELRRKESDRIAALCRGLGALGVDVEEAPDGFSIQGVGALRGGKVSPSGDHRLAMAFGVAGLAAGETVTVEAAEIIAESYPEFVSALRSLGAGVRLVA